VRRTAEEPLLPLEAQIEQRQAHAGRRERSAEDDHAARHPVTAVAPQ
jgi:hypothetical protein